MRIEVEGVAELRAALEKMGADFDAVARDAVLETATEIASKVKRSIAKGSPRGRQYARGKTATHTASAPGQAPASDTGRLVGSIYAALTGRLEATGGSPLAYAYYLEYGTRKMAARPVWLKTVKQNENTFRQAFEARLKGVIQ